MSRMQESFAVSSPRLGKAPKNLEDLELEVTKDKCLAEFCARRAHRHTAWRKESQLLPKPRKLQAGPPWKGYLLREAWSLRCTLITTSSGAAWQRFMLLSRGVLAVLSCGLALKHFTSKRLRG